jgi:hypothetical protein
MQRRWKWLALATSRSLSTAIKSPLASARNPGNLVLNLFDAVGWEMFDLLQRLQYFDDLFKSTVHVCNGAIDMGPYRHLFGGFLIKAGPLGFVICGTCVFRVLDPRRLSSQMRLNFLLTIPISAHARHLR